MPAFPAQTPAARSSAVVGGFPWAGEAAPSGGPVLERIDLPQSTPQRRHQPSPTEPFSWHVVRERIERFVDRSPAFTVSLSLHILLFLALAAWTVRQAAPVRLRLTLAFGPSANEVGRQEGREEIAAVDVVEIEQPKEQDGQPEQNTVTVIEPVSVALPPTPAAEEPTEAVTADAGAAGTAPVIAIGTALTGRESGAREQLLSDGGGSDATEAAVTLALEWIVRQQKKDGLWSLTGSYGDGGTQENRLAASAMALIALQGAGNTNRDGPHAAAVSRAWKALVRTQAPDGTFDAGRIPEQHAMYAHAQATIALCEIYGMTKDPAFAEPARLALEYALAAQMPDGGWRYQPPQPGQENRGDMSVTGWYLMALKSGEMAGLHVPSSAYDSLRRFLDSVFVSAEKGYGYQINPNQKFFDFRPALTAEGLLCRQYLGLPRNDPQLIAGVELLLREAPIDFDYRRKNVYAWYYATQVCHHMEGRTWAQWNSRMQEQLLGHQVQTGREKGSWDPANDQWGHVGGRLYVTALCACMLEVYYRHMPLYSRQ